MRRTRRGRRGREYGRSRGDGCSDGVGEEKIFVKNNFVCKKMIFLVEVNGNSKKDGEVTKRRKNNKKTEKQ